MPRVGRLRRLRTAAVLLLLVPAALLGWSLFLRPPSATKGIEALAPLVLEDHLETPVLAIRTGDPHELEARLGALLPFPVVLPELQTGWRLEGGRRCEFDAHPLAYSRWTGPGGRHSLFQFRAKDFRIPATFAAWRLNLEAPLPEGPACQVQFWTQGGNAYALVSDPGAPPAALPRPGDGAR